MSSTSQRAPLHGGAPSGAAGSPPGGSESLQQFVRITRDHHLAQLAALAADAAAANTPVADARALYAAALSLLSQHGVLDLASVVCGGVGGRGSALGRFLIQALSMISQHGQGRIVPCEDDETLPGPPQARYLWASNLHNSEQIMPNYVLQLLRLALALPPGDLFVMVYESGSRDGTARWLYLLQLLLAPIGVPANITANGGLVRQAGQERIDYLVQVRNALVAPFFNSTCVPPQTAADTTPPPGCFSPHHILFVNDVFFCPGDAVRLMQHQDTDMACAVDVGKFGNIRRRERRLEKRRQLLGTDGAEAGDWRQQLQQGMQQQKQQQQQQQQAVPEPEEQWGGGDGWQQQGPGDSGEMSWLAGAQLTQGSSSTSGSSSIGRGSISSRGGSLGAARKLASAAADEPHWQFPHLLRSTDKPNFGIDGVVFYDIWVVRDRTGSRFNWNKPWAANQQTADQLRSGLPLPMYCCWNGMVQLNPEPFRRGLRFRTHLHGECRASECSLLCDDYHRMGFSRVLLDPSVRVGYGYAHKWVMTAPDFDYTNVTGFNTTNWAAVAAAPPINWTAPAVAPAYGSVECCDKQPKDEGVDFGKCHRVNVLSPNYSAKFLKQCLPSILRGRSAHYLVDLPANQTLANTPLANRTLAACPTA